MHDLAKIIRQCIRNYRTAKKLSQKKLAEFCSCHPAYIGQVERGEKNATLESIEKIPSTLAIPLSPLFEKSGTGKSCESIPLKCYEFMAEKSASEQEHLWNMLLKMDKYKKQ